jgi:uncharacterized protein YnzC (UPF0291/DUF896 family)
MKAYLVQKVHGSFYEAYSRNIFATTSKENAEKYIEKFNRLLEKWKEYYSQFEEKEEGGVPWLKEKYMDKFRRWEQISDIIKCKYVEIEIR